MNLYSKEAVKGKLKAWLPAAVVMILIVLTAFSASNAGVYDSLYDESETCSAVVTEIKEDNVSKNENGVYQGSQTMLVEIKDGSYAGKELTAYNNSDQFKGIRCEEGTKVVVSVSGEGEDIVCTVVNYDRSNVVLLLVILFALVMVIIAGKKGFMSLLGLTFTFVTLIWVMIPLLYNGFSPYIVAPLWGIAVTFATIILVSGFNRKSAAAILGTFSGVIIAGIMTSLFGAMSGVSGYSLDYAEELALVNSPAPIDIGGLLFAGVLAASIGAVMDVGMSVASAVNEIYQQNSRITFKELFRSGMNVGRDMMGTMSNTLILAFTGSSVTLILLLYSYQANYSQMISMNDIMIEIIRGLAGSLGIFSAVPITSLITSWLVTFKNGEKKQ